MPPSYTNISDEEFNDHINKGSLVVLRGMDRDTVFAYTEMQDIHEKKTIVDDNEESFDPPPTKQGSNSCWNIL